MAEKICAVLGGVLSVVGCALMAYTAFAPDWFHATYAGECAVGKIGLFESEWSPASCSGGRISGDDVTLDTSEYWPLFPLQFPNITGNPMQPITQEFVDCETSVEAVYTFVNSSIAALTPLLETLDSNFLQLEDSDTWKVLAVAGVQGLGYTEAEAIALVDRVIGYTQACVAAKLNELPAGTQFAACGEFLVPYLIDTNLATAFNSDAPEDKAAAVQACEDDNIDYDNLKLGQILVPVGAALAGVGGLLGAASLAAAPLAIAGALLSLGGAGAMFAVLMILRGTPAAASVGEECAGIERACYTSELNGILGLTSVVLCAVASGLFIGSFIMAKRNASNALVSL